MQPRSEGPQRCIRFGLSTAPAARVKMYPDHEGNMVHHFTIPGRHGTLILTAEALVECATFPEPPDALGADAWERIDALTAPGAFWELLNPSPFARHTPPLDELAREIGLERGHDPLMTLRRLMAEMYARFEVHPPNDARRFANRRRAPGAAGSVPGFRPHPDRAHPSAWRALSLRERLSVPERRPQRSIRRRRDARVGRDASSGSRMDWVRSHQQPHRRQPPYSRGDWARLRRRAADARRVQGRCRLAQRAGRRRRRRIRRSLRLAAACRRLFRGCHTKRWLLAPTAARTCSSSEQASRHWSIKWS